MVFECGFVFCEAESEEERVSTRDRLFFRNGFVPHLVRLHYSQVLFGPHIQRKLEGRTSLEIGRCFRALRFQGAQGVAEYLSLSLSLSLSLGVWGEELQDDLAQLLSAPRPTVPTHIAEVGAEG